MLSKGWSLPHLHWLCKLPLLSSPDTQPETSGKRKNVHPEQVGPAVSLPTASIRVGWQPWATACNKRHCPYLTDEGAAIHIAQKAPLYEGVCVLILPRCSQGLQQDPQKAVMTDL